MLLHGVGTKPLQHAKGIVAFFAHPTVTVFALQVLWQSERPAQTLGSKPLTGDGRQDKHNLFDSDIRGILVR